MSNGQFFQTIPHLFNLLNNLNTVIKYYVNIISANIKKNILLQSLINNGKYLHYFISMHLFMINSSGISIRE